MGQEVMCKKKEVIAMLNTIRLDRLVKEKNMKDMEVAFRIGVSPSVFSFYKSHKRDIKAKELRMIADMFGVTMDELYHPNPLIRD